MEMSVAQLQILDLMSVLILSSVGNPLGGHFKLLLQITTSSQDRRSRQWKHSRGGGAEKKKSFLPISNTTKDGETPKVPSYSAAKNRGVVFIR